MNDKQQLAAMGAHMAEQPMCMAKQIEDLQARLQECAKGSAKTQEQRDALAKQVLDLTASIANSLTARLDLNGIDAALAGKLPDHVVDASKMVPDGWQMVPIELTRAMREAFHDAHDEWESGDNWHLDCPDHQWSAMLAAAPKPEAK